MSKLSARLAALVLFAIGCGGGGDDPPDAPRPADARAPDASAPDADPADASPPDATPVDAPPADADLTPDAVPPDALVCAPALNPTSDGSPAANQALLMSEINPGNYIELYNRTASPIDLDTVSYWFCSPFAYEALATIGAGVTVPAGGYAVVPWPAFFTDTDAGGEVMLYLSPAFAVNDQIMDFVCWGTNPHASRQAQAAAFGKWNSASPTSCAPPLTNGAIHRLPLTDGINAADYSTVLPPTPQTCTP